MNDQDVMSKFLCSNEEQDRSLVKYGKWGFVFVVAAMLTSCLSGVPV